MTSQRSLEVKFRILPILTLSIVALTVLIALAAPAIAQNPVPFIDQPLVPDAAVPGGAEFTLTVNGAGFVAGSVVNWNGSPRATTFVSSSQLTAKILASDIATASTGAVTVVNPSPGGGVSNTQFFSITVAGATVSFLPAVAYGSGTGAPHSVAVADVNGDGKPDLVVANWNGESNGDGSVGALLGNGDGTFQPVLTYDSGGTGATSVAVADVNGDGKPDLVVANCGPSGPGGCLGTDYGVVSVLLGSGDGTFRAAVNYGSGGLSADSVAVADVNGDGKLDIIVVSYAESYYNSTSGTVSVLLGNGDGTFQAAVTYLSGAEGATSVAVADLRGDGRLDLVAGNSAYCPQYIDGCVSVLLGNGDGTFQPAVTYEAGPGETMSVAVVDVNGDGKPDLLVANWCPFCANTVGVLLGNGDGTFQPEVTYSPGEYVALSIAAVDVNGDGRPDLLVANQCTGKTICTNPNGSIGVLLNSGDGTFESAVTYYSGGQGASSIAVADVNGHGRPDLIVANEGSATVAVLLNNTESSTTTTTLTSSLNPSLVGQAITFTATVSSTAGIPPNGETITFKNDSVFFGTASLSGGVASLTTSSLAAGIYTITATYGGDANFAASTSPGLRQVVNSTTKSATATTLTSSLNPSIYGQSVTWTAKVTTSGPLPPTGEVNFTWGDSIGGAPLNASGVATLTRSTENADTYPLTAVYEGDANNAISTAAVLNQVIKEATSTATLTSSPNPSTQGQAVTFTATITSPTVTATGPVTFTAGKTVLGTGQLSGGKATFTTSTLPTGTTPITATYYGDSNIAESSASVVQTVTSTSPNSTTTTLSASPNPSQFGEEVTFTAKVISNLGSPPNGEIVTFYNGSAILGPGLLSGGETTLVTSSLPGGTFSITAKYGGDSTFLGSTSSPLSQIVETSTTAATVTWVADPPQNETFTATVTGPKGIPTGTVTFTVGSTTLGTVTLSGGVAALTVSTLAVGSNTVTATYSGDTNNPPTSAWTTQTFVVPYNATLYLQQMNGMAGAITEFGTGTTPANFVEYYSGLPNDPDPAGQVLVGSFTAGTIVNFGMFTQYSQSGWAFSDEVGANQAALISFADLSNALGLNHSITQQTSSTTWVLWLDDAVSYLYDDDNNDVIMEIILVPN
jgi:hypothetical protein